MASGLASSPASKDHPLCWLSFLQQAGDKGILVADPPPGVEVNFEFRDDYISKVPMTYLGHNVWFGSAYNGAY